MGITVIANMRHFSGIHDPTIDEERPAPVTRLGGHLGRIVEAVTASWHPRGTVLPTMVPCRCRPGHKPCSGFIEACLPAEHHRIEWRCARCDDNGFINGWEGTQWDFSSVNGPGLELQDEMAELVVTPDEYDAIRRILVLDREAERVVKAALLDSTHAEILIQAPGVWLDLLVEQIAAEANHPRSRKDQALLDGVLDKPVY